MRIVLEPSESDFWNVGDVAMTHVAYTRIAALWPHAAIQVLAEPSDLLSVRIFVFRKPAHGSTERELGST